VLALMREDVDLEAGILTIRGSKFQKYAAARAMHD